MASATAVDSYSLGSLTIDKLSDDVLLCIFDSYRRISEKINGSWPWHALVHTCRRWRNLVFERPGHLNLRLVCNSKTDVKAALDIWPALPIAIHATFKHGVDEDDTIGVLEDRDRTVGITLRDLNQSKLEKCLGLMQKPFPVLTSLDLHTENDKVAHINTEAFLGGSAPRLKRVSLIGIRFSALPTLLSSASELVDLHIGYSRQEHISPEAMSTCLSSLTRLQSLSIGFEWSPEFTYPRSQHPPPSTLAPTVLPALTKLSLGGPHEYLEDLLTRLDTPLLEKGNLSWYDVPDFDNPHVSQFIHRTGMFNSPSVVDVYIRKAPYLQLLSDSSISPEKEFIMSFSSSDSRLYTEVSLMEEFFAGCPPLLSHIEQLKLSGSLEGWYMRPHTAPWLEFLQPFTAVQTLHLSGKAMILGVSRTLGELEKERATEVLPALHTLWLEWPPREVSKAARLVEPFIVARKHSENPVVVERESDSDPSDADSSDADSSDAGPSDALKIALLSYLLRR